MKTNNQMKHLFLTAIISLVAFFASAASAQTTAFNFQGRLNDGSSPANGRYDLQFKLYDAITGGSQVDSTITKSNLTLINGVFSTPLDFGATAFSGADRFIEIGLRQSVSGSTTPNAFVILGPRQQILSVPYTIRSAKATLADNATASDYATGAGLATDSNRLGGYSSERYLRYSSNDNVGIGTGTDLPADKLTVKTATGSYGIIQTDGVVQVGTAVGTANNGEVVGGFGTKSNHTLRLFTNSNGSGGMTLDVNSNLRQPSNAYGLVKALAEVDLNGNVLKCYNSNLQGTAATTAPCGISVNHFTNGGYGMNFGFRVNFISATLQATSGFSPTRQNGMIRYEYGTGTNINIRTAFPEDNTDTNDGGFMVIVY